MKSHCLPLCLFSLSLNNSEWIECVCVSVRVFVCVCVCVCVFEYWLVLYFQGYELINEVVHKIINISFMLSPHRTTLIKTLSVMLDVSSDKTTVL